MFARLLQFGEVTDFAHAPCQIRADLRCFVHLPRVAHRFFGRQRRVVRLPRVRRDAQHLKRDCALRLLEAPPLDLQRLRHRQQREHIDRQRLFNGVVAHALLDQARAHHREMRVRQPPCLHQIRLAEAQIEIRGLQTLVVQQGDLHGIFDRQRFGRQLADTPRNGLLLGFGLGPDNVFAEPIARSLLDARKTAVR